ncbi:MAG: response regulator transcription factor [Acidobacteria bacterium]|nr:response regulator transcription factor [Acidobacteriota bacterium]
MSDSPRALIVEDEQHIRDLITLHLGLEGFICTPSADGRDALATLNEQRFDIVVLDLMIPSIDGLAVCRAVRRGGPNADTPILMLTARREESDKVLGLESGADDYLTKPFGVREFIARVRALLRRAGARTGGEGASTQAGGSSDEVYRVMDLEIDLARHRVRVAGAEVDLTAQEFNLLRTLASRPGIVFTRDALLTNVWKGDTFVTERSVDALVKRLRKKIEPDAATPRYVLTVWGSGYKFADE